MRDWLEEGIRPVAGAPAESAPATPPRTLLVDGDQVRLLSLRRHLDSAHVPVIGHSDFGPPALLRAQETAPDVILVAVDGNATSTLLTVRALAYPGAAWTVVGLAEQLEPELLRQLMLAGARDVVLRDWDHGQLLHALESARSAGLRSANIKSGMPPAGVVIAVFGVKGGIGKTTLSTNLAVSLARETSRRVVLVDLDVPFGDDALMLNVEGDPDFLTALEDAALPDPERLLNRLVRGPEGLRILSGTIPGDLTGLVEPRPVVQLLERLAELHDFVVVDTPPGVNELNAAALDVSTTGLLISTPEIACLRRSRQCLTLLKSLGFSQDRLKLVLNRSSSKTSLNDEQATSVLAHPISWRIENDHTVLDAAAHGQPVVTCRPQSGFARGVRGMARQIAGLPANPSKPWWQRIRRVSPRPLVAAASL
jgi:pilus assembly protein CpaE